MTSYRISEVYSLEQGNNIILLGKVEFCKGGTPHDMCDLKLTSCKPTIHPVLPVTVLEEFKVKDTVSERRMRLSADQIKLVADIPQGKSILACAIGIDSHVNSGFVANFKDI